MGNQSSHGVPPPGPLDPYEVFGLEKYYTWDELKNAYRRVSMLVHPDKGGTDALFQAVTDAFRKLALDLKAREADRPHHELKQQSQQFMEHQQSLQPTQINIKDESFQNRFNRLFQENRLEDDNDAGYGHLMAPSESTREDINIPKVISKFDNQSFDKLVPVTKEVVRYEEPEALVLAKRLQFTELGKKVTDFSTDPTTTTKKNLAYTDYLRAHTTQRLMVPTDTHQRIYHSIEEYEQAREKEAARELTSEERERLEQKRVEQQQQEQERQRRLQERDRRLAEHHARMQQAMLMNKMA